MALYIITKARDFEHHFGEKRPDFEVQHVTEIQADCDELEVILGQFVNLPHIRGARSMKWFGDQAKFIAQNIRY